MLLNRDRLRELLLLAGLCGFLFFFRLSAIGLLGPDEPRYAQIAREMLQRHDWVTPFLYQHTWLEKPILLYWAEMISYSYFGIADWAARVPAAVFATAMVVGTFLTVRRVRHNARLDAALLVASSALVLGFARAAATDMLLAAPFAVGLLCWFCWYQSEFEPSGTDTRHARLYLLAFYACNALAALAKGPVAPALAGLILIVFCLVQRQPRAILRTLHLTGILLFVAIAAPWYVTVQRHTPEFFRIFFLQHNLARFSSNLYRHPQPFWYYVPVALAAVLPWTVWLFPALAESLRALRAQLRGVTLMKDDGTPEGSYSLEIFLLLWALIPIVFFSLSRSKLPGYILPAVPALLVLTAVGFHRRAARDERPHWVAICAHAALLAALAGALIIAPRLMLKLPASPQSLMVAAVAGTVVFVVVAVPLLTGGWRMLRFVTLLPFLLMVGFVLRGLAPLVDATQSARPVAVLLSQMGQPGQLPLATFGVNRNTALGLSFYLDTRVVPYEGLEVSPAVYELPAAVPAAHHILVAREGSTASLRLLLGEREVRFIGSSRAQRVEIFEVAGSAGE